MKIIINIIILLYSTSLCAQNISALKEQDTIYLILSNTNNVIREYKNFNLRSNSNKKVTEYIFTMPNNKPIYIITRENDIKSEKNNFFIRRKNIFRQKQAVIIDIKYIEEYGAEQLFLRLLNHKHLYVVNEEDINNRKFKAKQAYIIPIGYIEM